jgi:hypothetical protein
MRARQGDRQGHVVAFRKWPLRTVAAKSASETSNLRAIKTFEIGSFGIFLKVPPRRCNRSQTLQ